MCLSLECKKTYVTAGLRCLLTAGSRVPNTQQVLNSHAGPAGTEPLAHASVCAGGEAARVNGAPCSEPGVTSRWSRVVSGSGLVGGSGPAGPRECPTGGA